MKSNGITGREFLIFATDCHGYHERSLLQIKILFCSPLNSKDVHIEFYYTVQSKA